MREKQLEPYRGDRPRTDEEFEAAKEASTGRAGPGFIGVWDINDNGNVPPRAIIQGPQSRLIAPGGVALNPKRGELYAVDGGSSAYYTFLVPQFFKSGRRERRRQDSSAGIGLQDSGFRRYCTRTANLKPLGLQPPVLVAVQLAA